MDIKQFQDVFKLALIEVAVFAFAAALAVIATSFAAA